MTHFNSDPNEIQKFSDMAASWWDPEGVHKPLHQLNPIRYQFIQDIVKNHNLDLDLNLNKSLNNLNILDIGCGGGILTEKLAQSGANLTGLDLSESLIEVAKLHALSESLNINYICDSIESHAETIQNNNLNQYDLITCMEMLEHVPDPENIIQAASKTLKPNGLAFFSTLNRTPSAFLGAIVGAEYLFKLLPRGTHHYEKFIQPKELIQMARKYNLEPIDSLGIQIDPFTQNFKQSDKLNINYILAFEKIS